MVPHTTRQRLRMCGISKVETIPAIVDAKPDYMGLVFAPSKRQVTVDQAKTLVEELHKQYAKYMVQLKRQ